MEDIAIILLALVILSMPLFIYCACWHTRIITMREYHRIQIGDKFTWTIHPASPFKPASTITVVIVDKMIDSAKRPWVSYRDEDGTIYDDELDDFLIHYKPSNKQSDVVK